MIPNGSSVPSGTTVHDSATVSGGLTTPTGTVTFTFFTNGTCDGAGQAAGVVALTGGVADPSTAFGPLAAGSYSFRATYNGDTTHNASPPSGCEPFSVDKANTTTVTAIHNDANHNVIPNGSSVPSGTTVHDSATVSGGLTTPTGTVTFTFFTNGTCDGAGQAAGVVALTGGVADPSTAFGPLAAGSYSFRATYNGDTTHNVSPPSGCEPFSVDKANTTTVTAIHNDANHNVIPNGSSVPSGTTVHDSATVSGGLTTPTGTVTFTFFTNGTCDGAGQAAGVVALNSGVADPSTAFGPLAAGSYSFRATYNGDTTHNASPPSACEPFSVDKANTTTVTAIHNDANHNVIPNGSSVPLGTTVHDSATVSGGLTTPTGTVTFTFFTNGTCDRGRPSRGTIALTGGVADPSTASGRSPRAAATRSGPPTTATPPTTRRRRQAVNPSVSTRPTAPR